MKQGSRLSFLTAAAALPLAPRIARAQTLTTVRVCGFPTDDLTPIYWGVKTGAYRKAGIDLEVVPVSSGTAATQAVVGGAYEIGKASPIASILAHVKGLPVTIVANGAIFQIPDRWSAMMVANDSSIKSGSDCNGKIGAGGGLNDIGQVSMMAWIDKNGGDSKSVKFTELPSSAVVAALTEHRIDFALLNEPLLSAGLATGKVRALAYTYGAIAERWLAAAYLAQPDFANKHPEAVRSFARVTYETAAYTNAHEAETIALMSEVSKIPPAVFAKMNRIKGATAGDSAVLQPLIEAVVRYKLLPASIPATEMYWTG